MTIRGGGRGNFAGGKGTRCAPQRRMEPRGRTAGEGYMCMPHVGGHPKGNEPEGGINYTVQSICCQRRPSVATTTAGGNSCYRCCCCYCYPVTIVVAAAAVAAAALRPARVHLVERMGTRTARIQAHRCAGARVCIRLTCVREGKGLSRIRGCCLRRAEALPSEG